MTRGKRPVPVAMKPPKVPDIKCSRGVFIVSPTVIEKSL